MKRLAAIGIVAVILGAIVLLFLHEHAKDEAAKEAVRRANELVAFAQTTKPLLAAPAAEPDHVTGRVLPVIIGNSDPAVVYGGTAVAPDVYAALAPALRTDRLADARTVMFIELEKAFYAGNGAIDAAATGATLTFYEGTVAVARKTIALQQKQLQEATHQQLADDRDRMAQVIAVYVNGLPRR